MNSVVDSMQALSCSINYCSLYSRSTLDLDYFGQALWLKWHAKLGIERQIQVDAGTGFGESLMGERPVEFLVQQSNG